MFQWLIAVHTFIWHRVATELKGVLRIGVVAQCSVRSYEH